MLFLILLRSIAKHVIKTISFGSLESGHLSIFQTKVVCILRVKFGYHLMWSTCYAAYTNYSLRQYQSG